MVLIGAGSAVWTRGIIADWLARKYPGEWEIALVDINPVILKAMDKLVRRYMLTTDHPAKITSAVDRRDVLDDATIVISTIGVGSRRAWEQDVFIPRKFGIYQPVGDSVMPGGVSRALRMIPPMLDIAHDVERMCPNAIFINYSNPMTSIVRALHRKTTLDAIGLCIGTEDGVRYLADLISVPRERVTARWVGVNHLTWITDIYADGENAWPRIQKKVAELRRNGIDHGSWSGAFGAKRDPNKLNFPFSWELYDEFHAFPAPMDRHVTEYFPAKFRTGKYYGSVLGVDAYSFEKTIASGDKAYDEILRLAEQDGPMDSAHLESTSGEHEQALDIIDSLQHDGRRWYSANLPNNGIVSNLPKDAVLELPAIATKDGMRFLPWGEAPTPIASILLRRLGAVEATVEAALTGNRRYFVEALILDGGVADYATASKLADALLKAQARHLPQFS